MADSNITKQALSNALKELLEEQPFEKISISDICDRCRMNRKSFYYHFREFLQPILRLRVTELLEQDDVPQMVYDFVVDGIICAIERWLLDKNCAPGGGVHVQPQASGSGALRGHPETDRRRSQMAGIRYIG